MGWQGCGLGTMARWPQREESDRPQGLVTYDIPSAAGSCWMGLGPALARLMLFRALFGFYWRTGGEAMNQGPQEPEWPTPREGFLEPGAGGGREIAGRRQVLLGVLGVLVLVTVSSTHTFNKCLFVLSL